MAKRITIKDISEALGVSRGTVDRALHDRGRIDSLTKEKILNYAKEIGYVPNSIARALVMQHNFRIAVVLPSSPRYFFSIIAKGIRDAAQDLIQIGTEINLEFIYTKDVGDWERQINILQDISESDYDGLIVIPSNLVKVTPYINKVVENGTCVVTVNNDAPESKRMCYIGEDSIKAGRVAGELMAKFAEGEGAIAILTGSKDSPSMSERTKGFESYFKDNKTGFILKGPFEYNEREVIAYGITKDLIAENDDLKGIYLTTTTGLEATARAVMDAGKSGEIKIIGPDINRNIRRMMKQDMIHATIYQAPREQGYNALIILSRKLTDNMDPDDKVVHTKLAIMMKELSVEDYEM